MPISTGLSRHLSKKFGGLTWQSGNFYEFKYKAFTNDPKPLIIFMYAFSGYHPNTGREWRFFQAINFSYVPRNKRKQFLKEYLKIKDRRKGNMRFVWNDVVTKYPGLKIAVRRYFYSPANRIINPVEIPIEDAEKKVMGTIMKDFSKKAIMSIRKKLRYFGGKKKKKKTKKKKR